MNRRKVMGLTMLTGSSLLLVVYTYLLFFAETDIQGFVLKISVFLLIALLLGGMMIIGLGLLRSPLIPPSNLKHDDPVCECSESPSDSCG